VEHDLSENRSQLFRIMLTDGRFARPRFSFVWHRGSKCCIECGITCGITIPLSRRVISAFTRVFDALWRASFIIAIANGSRASKIRSREARNRSGPGRGGGGACLSFVR
jgi:hypothetical protein